MLTSGQKPAPSNGRTSAPRGPERPADHQQRREHAARRAGAERHRPDRRLHEQDADDDPHGRVAGRQHADDVVADAERLAERCSRRRRSPGRRSPATTSSESAGDERRPPTRRRRIDRSAASAARHDADDDAADEAARADDQRGCAGTGNIGPSADEMAPQRARRHARERHGNDAARLQLEQQELDRQQAPTRRAPRRWPPCRLPRRRRAASCAPRW